MPPTTTTAVAQVFPGELPRSRRRKTWPGPPRSVRPSLHPQLANPAGFFLGQARCVYEKRFDEKENDSFEEHEPWRWCSCAPSSGNLSREYWNRSEKSSMDDFQFIVKTRGG